VRKLEVFLDHFLGDNFSVIVTRLLIALVLTGLIGFERELNNHSAGFRTHILVGVGACLMMILSLFGFTAYMEAYDNVRFDPARIPSYVISGIGFLGAGTIIVYGGTIRGLTTAATIWTVAGIGLVIGAGMYGPAVIATIIILISLRFLNKFESWFKKGRSTKLVEIILNPKGKLTDIVFIVEKHDGTIKNLEIKKEDHIIRKAYIKIEWQRIPNMVHLFEEISNQVDVLSVSDRH